jgi:hypothetical protein
MRTGSSACSDSFATERLIVELLRLHVPAKYHTWAENGVMTTISRLPDIHAFPECDVAFDSRCCIGGLGVIPCGVFIDFAIDD